MRDSGMRKIATAAGSASFRRHTLFREAIRTSHHQSATGALLDRLRGVDTSALCDAHKSLDPPLPLHLVNRDVLRPINAPLMPRPGAAAPPFKIAGTARTVQLTQPDDFLAVLRGLGECRAGDVLMVNALDSTRAVAGGLFLAEARRRGVCGIVVDGPVRDVADLRRPWRSDDDNYSAAVPLFARSVTPHSGTVRSAGSMQVEVECGGAPVRPGDLVVGDEDGLLFGPADTFEALIDSAEGIAAVEDGLMRGMTADGRSLHSMTNFEEHLEARMKGEESSLEFRLD